jgi:hypothetical protein
MNNLKKIYIIFFLNNFFTVMKFLYHFIRFINSLSVLKFRFFVYLLKELSLYTQKSNLFLLTHNFRIQNQISLNFMIMLGKI